MNLSLKWFLKIHNPHLIKNTMELSIIKNKIHNIQGNKVILDFDLAELYEVETRVLKQSR